MNKRLLIFVLIIIIVSFIYQEVNITGYSIYYQGDSFESGGKTITIERVSRSNAVIGVDGVKNIIGVGEYKIINNVKVEVISTFYADELEARNVDLAVNVLYAGTCGDGECKAGETSDSCCIDCGCPTDYRCEDNECVYSVPDECKKHEDCDDGNPETIDLCLNTNPKVCKNYILEEDGDIVEEYIGVEEDEDVTEKIEEKEGFFSVLIKFLKGLFSS